MAREKKPEEAKAGCPEWLATYGDMVTLVLTFFVLLFSMSSIDAEKWKLVATSLSGMPSIFDGVQANNSPIGEAPNFPSSIADLDVDDLEELMSSDVWEGVVAVVKQMLESGELSGEATMEFDANQIKLTLEGDVLFDSGKAILKEESVGVLVEVMSHLRSNEKLPLIGTFRIEGHTDNVPIDTYQYPDNWVLSQARAYTVMKYLQENFPPEEYPDMPYSMYSFEGRGEYQPIDTNDTPEGRSRNRRVEFYILKAPEAPVLQPEEAVPEG